MRAVSNTTPLRYLIAIHQENLLARLFEKVLVPPGVHQELTDEKTPEAVRRPVLLLPSWYEIRSVPENDLARFPASLHRGEREAILLAETVRADVLLIDEQAGRAIAKSRNLPLSGTLGILEEADRIGLITDYPQILQRLRSSGFFFTEALEQQLLDRHRIRRDRSF